KVSHRDWGWGIAWRGGASVAGLSGLLIHTVVAGRGHDDDARAHGVFDGEHERIGLGRLVNRVAERQVDDVDIELVSVLDRKLERSQDRTRIARPVLIEHLEADDACSWRDTLIWRDLDVLALAVREHLDVVL